MKWFPAKYEALYLEQDAVRETEKKKASKLDYIYKTLHRYIHTFGY